MELTNPLYKNIGAHVVSSIFTIEKGEIKVLLIKRKNEPYKDSWALVGGALYNTGKYWLLTGRQEDIHDITRIFVNRMFPEEKETT